jgi:hypothetical protein
MRSLHLPLLVLLITSSVSLAGNGPTAWWNFDSGNVLVATDAVNGSNNQILGYGFHAEGVIGSALRFDGFTTRVNCRADAYVDIQKGFTVEAWIAPQEYSWNWTGIVDQEKGHREGFSFGIDYVGRVGLMMALDGEWRGVISDTGVPLLEWTHVAATYDPDAGIAVFINGRPVGQEPVTGEPVPSNEELWIGMSHTKQWPALTVFELSKIPSNMLFDGLIDEVKLYAGALNHDAVLASFRAVVPDNPQPLQRRKLPSLPEGPGAFGAYYTRLKYAEEWDRLWRVSDHPDIVIRFDESPVKIVFWRGTGYIPVWVTENGLWMSDQGPEIFSAGCYEVMADKHCRFSHVRVIENTPARVLVHWRTALPDPQLRFIGVDSITGWGPWGDDYFYIYPDGVSVRYQRVWGQNIHEFQQSEVLCQPGTMPQDILEDEPITVMDMHGNTNTYVWKKLLGERVPADKEVNGPIQITNLRSEDRHYVIGEQGAYWERIGFPGREGYSNFASWNHWPVAQIPNDGRDAPVPDRPSSTCLGTLFPVRHQGEGGMNWVRDLYGMTDRDPKHLAVLARSWNNAPGLVLQSGSFTSQGYDKSQRAYILNHTGSGDPVSLAFEIEASKESPVFNLPLIIENWGNEDVRLTLDGKPVKQGKNFRVGHNHRLQGVDLIVWIKTESFEPLQIRLERKRSD